MATATLFPSMALLGIAPSAQASTPMPPTGSDVCAIVTSMPDAEDTDTLLNSLDTSRSQVTMDLIAMSRNMEQYDAEGYGWQNVIDGSSALEPQPGAWLIGALRMACDPQAASTVSGTVTYPQRMALPPNATLVVTLEDVSRADAPSTVIAGKTIQTAGQQVPIPFSLTYDPAEIAPQNRYVVRAQIFYDGALQWASTTAYPVITQDNPTEVEIQLEQI
ncbi:MAG: YbaY family lipoprotein [Leptolyngbya sp.]|nr:YbaY family lipoprotein [Leptolyngbya sp.]